MDICVLNQFFYPYYGGTEKVLLEIYSRLSKKHNITVLTSAIPGTEPNESVRGINIVRLKSRKINVPFAPLPLVAMDELNKKIIELDADAYHINNRYQYFGGTINAIKSQNKKLVLTIHNSLPKGIDFITDFGGLAYDVFWGRKVMKAADAISGVSENAVKVTVPKSMMDKARVIYNGVDYAAFRFREKSSKEVRSVIESLNFDPGPILLSNGRLTKQKGHEYIIKALGELAKEGMQINFIVIGKGPLKDRMLELSRRFGILDRVRIVEGISEGELPFYYNAADAFVFPSLYEPAGMALMEAMASCTPVITTGVGGIPEVVKDYGEYIIPKSSGDLKRAILKVLSSISEYRERASTCRETTIIKEHDWDKIANEYGSLFESLG
ncbi:glycosyltransferase family 4 protein [Candidatus Marsarchaeota archaeon]|nr:glycosyltransferase family 4 protein [Candidatus Marsarchaeota archaeon]MCL5404897.1 glycosyltransferase family 4 protein [Candidatus Marsarchaeota archaeon]